MKSASAAALFALSVLALLPGCSREQPSGAAKAPPPTVSVAPVVSREVPRRLDFTASIVAVNSVTVRARVDRHGSPALGLIDFHHMPPLLPRKNRWDALVVASHRRRPSPSDHRVGFFD